MLAEAVAAETRAYVVTPDRTSDIDAWIESVGAKWRLPEDVVFRTRVCVAEIAANLMEHGRSRTDGDDIRITLRPAAPFLEVEISDSGREFDPTTPAAVTLATDTYGGRGLRLLHAYATAMSYRRAGGRNQLMLRVGPKSRDASPGGV
jgi:anti-sigma regulatory factor (Ser/Thr protein kinase)